MIIFRSPILFSELAESELPAELRPIIADLLERKAKSPELGEDKRIDILNEYVENGIASLTAAADNLPRDPASDWSALNELFIKQF